MNKLKEQQKSVGHNKKIPGHGMEKYNMLQNKSFQKRKLFNPKFLAYRIPVIRTFFLRSSLCSLSV